jgi:3-oxoacyl-[acyl-carrier protein] reductase
MKKFALVCGASGAIGEAICHELAADGWSLYLHYSNGEERINQLYEKLILSYPQHEFFKVRGDFLQNDCAQLMAQQIFSLHAIVFANGQALYELLDDTSQQQMSELWKVHVETPMLLCKTLAPKLRHHPTSYVLFISSIWGEVGASGEVVYSAVKGAQNSFVKAYAQEVALSKINVNAIAPGIIETTMNSHLSDMEHQEILEQIPLQRYGKPIEVAQLASYLLSGKADYMTGQILRLNGGWYI